MKLLFLALGVALLGGCSTIYCHRIGDNYPGSFLCSDKIESSILELDLRRLKGKKVPDEWTRVKLTLYPFYPIRGVSVWPFGYSMKDYSRKYNDGSEIK